MDSLYTSGLQFITWLQSLGTWLTPVMRIFTFLGNEQFYLLVAPAILWCIDASLGLRMGIFLMINGMLNLAIKVAIHGPRPYWYSSQVNALGAAENSYGAPSGHAQNAVVVWGTLAERIKTRAAWIIAIVLMFLIGLSRLYLAVHFPHDVLLGWLLGFILLWVFLRLEKPVVDWLKKYQVGIQLLVIFLFSLFLILLVALAQLVLRGWSLPIEWVSNAHLAFPDEPEINPLSYHNFLSSAGAFLGLAAGWIWITRLGGYTTRDPWHKLLLRYLLGVVGVLILYVGLGSLFADTETFISYAWRYIRYALIGFWISGFAPWIFVKIKLASSLK
ncbi:MAG TPA: phosphatase PAP2 family protein [Anaerolineales bacterium]|nr:phosphatase PAP2 family protein [Anaerolineales bacterium]